MTDLDPSTACPVCHGTGKFRWMHRHMGRKEGTCGNCLGTGRINPLLQEPADTRAATESDYAQGYREGREDAKKFDGIELGPRTLRALLEAILSLQWNHGLSPHRPTEIDDCVIERPDLHERIAALEADCRALVALYSEDADPHVAMARERKALELLDRMAEVERT